MGHKDVKILFGKITHYLGPVYTSPGWLQPAAGQPFSSQISPSVYRNSAASLGQPTLGTRLSQERKVSFLGESGTQGRVNPPRPVTLLESRVDPLRRAGFLYNFSM